MPVYNGIEYINDSISSILDQTYQDWELIIGINGHQPNSLVYQLAKDYELVDSRIRVFEYQEVTGKSATLNKMSESCNYDFVALIDVDDIWLPTKLEKQVYFLKNGYDVVGTQCIYFGEMNGIVPSIPLNDISTYNFLQVNPIINSSSIIRKSECYWRPELNYYEDYDLWLRLRKSEKKFFNIPEVLVKHRIHKTSAFNSTNTSQSLQDLLMSFSR
uniref:Glycosyltransferase 2-like domain-containing protein n=1 Tax=viral metagenome TaxID=1070528 RepID=A0A6C0D5F2_9ZZZZ